ncbi:MAG: hypothetical protein NXI13_07170 [Proteobacteria bacterium]|nr:hypothetical protein [Pseudomonadota bacterium]
MTVFEHQHRTDNINEVARLDVTSSDEFKTGPVKSLYNWWESHQPDLPKYSDFDISENWAIAPYLYVIQALSPGRFLYRLNGEKVVEIIGISKRGHEITDRDSLLENRLLVDYLSPLVEVGRAKRCAGSLDIIGKQHLTFESVDCPLKNDRGEIEFIIGAIATL